MTFSPTARFSQFLFSGSPRDFFLIPNLPIFKMLTYHFLSCFCLDQIAHLATHWPNFNRSLTVSPLLSELDVRALLEHFVHVQIGQLDAEIEGIERQLEAEFDESERGWPIGFVGTAGHQPVPNRFQAPLWQLFNADGTILFGNDPDRNVERADQALRDELALVIELAKQKAEEANGGGAAGDLLISGGHFKAGRVRQGYR